MNKKLQVFVSSTYTDLIEERQAAVEAILDAGHIPAGMELFKAGKSQMKTIRKWIDDSDVYMLILGGRYGSIEEDSGLSYTELEYRYALSKNMPVFAIILDDKFLFTKAASYGKDIIFEKNNINKYDSFKKFVKTTIVKFVNNIDQISSIVHSHLYTLINDEDFNLIGWSRNVSISNETFDQLLNENKLLKTKIQELQSKLEAINKNKSTNLSYDVLIDALPIVKFPYYNHRRISVLDFFMLNYYKCQQEYWYRQGDESYNIFIFLEKFKLVYQTKRNDGHYDESYKFNLTQYGIDFYKYCQERSKTIK